MGHEKLDLICNISSKHGFHSKLTGGGGGGCAITLLPDNASKQKIQQLKDELESQGFSCFISYIGGPGVVFH